MHGVKSDDRDTKETGPGQELYELMTFISEYWQTL